MNADHLVHTQEVFHEFGYSVAQSSVPLCAQGPYALLLRLLEEV